MSPIAAAALLLAGCAADNALNSGPEAKLAPPAVAPQPAPPATRVTVAPVIGAPDAIGRQMQQDFTAAVGLQKVSLVSPGDRPDYTLKAFVVAAKDRTNTKVSYILDVIDPAGKRVNRIAGEESIAGQTPKDPWSAVTPDIVRNIAQKSAASFGQWLPTAQASAPIASAPTGVGAVSGVAPVQTASAPGAAATPPVRGTPQATVVSTPQGQGAATAVVPAVVGAPGDGGTSLTGAIQAELRKSGVTLTAQPAANTYRVEGVVKMGQVKDGKQPIRIDWSVRDPQGNKVGTVTQNNELPEGTLDGAWGKTADAVAQAAAQGILKLIPRT